MEFEDKAVAKRVAALLNGQQMGGPRRSAYHYDLWTLKYLPKFKWDHLTEEIGAHPVGPGQHCQYVMSTLSRVASACVWVVSCCCCKSGHST